MRPVTFTLYSNAQARQGEILTRPWADMIVELDLLNHEQRGTPEDTHNIEALNAHKNGRAVVLGSVQGRRSKKNVQLVEALGIDVDGQPDETIRNLLAVLEPFEYVIWTTHTNGAVCKPKGLRLRVVLPLAEPYAAEDHTKHWQGLQRLALGLNDPQTKDASRLHFLPSTFDPAHAFATHHPGRWLSIRDLPTAAAVAPPSGLDTYSTVEAGEAAGKILASASRAPQTNPLKPLLMALSAGAAFPEGQRHEAIVKLTWWLSGKNTRLTEATVRQVFERSLAAMVHQPDPPTFEECWTAYKGALEKRQENQGIDQAGAYGPYTQTELERIAESQGTTVAGLQTRWLLGREGRWWILQDDGTYLGSHSEKDASIVVRQSLKRAPIRLVSMTDTGEKFIPFMEVASKHSSVAQRVVADMTAQKTRFDAEHRTIYEATTPLRVHEARGHEGVARWLEHMSGKNHGKVLDWLACLPDLNKLLCAIYWDGPASSGKTLFAHGLAKLWADGGPGSLGMALNDFNGEIVRCPLLFADEALPKGQRKENITTQLREMLSTTARTLNRKFHEPVDLHGAIRLVLAANNESLLDTDITHTMSDLEAIAKRFLYIHIGNEAAKSNDALPPEVKKRWLEQEIAQHCLWLAENRIVTPASRFWVEGDLASMHMHLVMSSKWNAFVLEWCCGYLMDPTQLDQTRAPYVRRGEGKLYVNVEAITQHWDMYVTADRVQPTTAIVATSLRSISEKERKQIRIGNRRVRFYEVMTKLVISWAEHVGKGDRETIEAHLNNQVVADAGGSTLFTDNLETLPSPSDRRH